MQGCATMLGVVGQQCYVRLHGALVLRCYSIFQKKTNKQTKGERCFFRSVTQVVRKEKSELSQSSVKPYDLLVTIQPDALPLSYRSNDEWRILSLANTWERCSSSFSCNLLDIGFWTRKTMTNLTECGVTLLHFFAGFLVRVPTWRWRIFKSAENSNSCCYSIKMFHFLIWPLRRSVSQRSKRKCPLKQFIVVAERLLLFVIAGKINSSEGSYLSI